MSPAPAPNPQHAPLQPGGHAAGAPTVSVIIPTYNCEAYIAATLDAVLAQTHRPLEVIVVDDGSTDDTPHIVAGYAPAVRLERQQNQRVCRARNRGFELSTGDFVCFLDHDDHWFPWKLTRQLEAFAARPEAGVVFTAFHFWNPVDGQFAPPDSLAPADDSPPPVRADLTGWIYHRFLLDCWALTSTAMLRRNVFAASGGFNPDLPYSEDWDLWLRLSREHPFVMLDRVSTLYRQHPSQGSRMVRDVDYRTRLLEQARRQWGLASPDGNALSARDFDHNIARYHMEFGLHHAQHGSRRTGVGAFAKAWRAHPSRLKYAALWLAASVGWRPKL